MLRVLPNVTINMDGKRQYKNMVMQVGLGWLTDLVLSATTKRISHIAVGDSTSPVGLADAVLGNERARKPVSSLIKDQNNAIAEVFFDMNEGNFYWREIGLFVGGTDDKNTGLLIARVLVDESKDNTRTATISWEIGFANP